MTAHALMFVDKPTFYRFIVKADSGYRYEYVHGWIMQQQAGGTFDHVQIGRRISRIIERQLDLDHWAISDFERGVDTPETIRYPDVVVEPSGALGSSLSTSVPMIVVEVLSASSEERDLSAKPIEYMSLASLQAYVVASQDEPLCYVWLRRGDGSFAAAPCVVKGRDRSIQIASMSVTIPLAEIYRGIGE